jgi:hypothetical protein
MNLINWSADDLLGLEKFYAIGCVWTAQEMEDRSSVAARSARDWIELSLPPRDHPLILPRVIESKHIFWYAIAFNETQAEQLRGDLMAFVGSAGTNFDGRRVHLDESDEAESALLDWIGGQWAFRLPVCPSHYKEVRRSLERMRAVWALKPQLKSTLLRTTEALIREFFLSLANGNELNAGHILKELKLSGRLSAENVVFLEIEKLAAFGRWGAIAAHSQLSYLKMMRRPRHITALLVEALWITELSSFADAGDAKGILNYYKTQFRGRYHALLRSYGNSVNESVLMPFLLAAVGDEHPRYEQIPKLLERLGGSPYCEFAKALAGQVQAPGSPVEVVEVSPLACAKKAYQSDDLDTAWERILEVESTTVESLRLMLDCVEELDTIDAALVVKQKFEDLDETTQSSVLSRKRHQHQWNYVVDQTTVEVQSLPSDWETWVGSLAANDLGADCLLGLARESVEWSVEVYLNSPERVGVLATSLTACSSEDNHVLHLAFPHLVSFFLKEDMGVREFLPIYLALLEVLVLGDAFSSEDWNTTESLLSAVLEAGLDHSQYSDLLEHLYALWDEHGSVVKIDWALDTLDWLAVYPCQNSDVLNLFYQSVVNQFTVDSRRIRTNQWEMLKLLSEDLGFSVIFNAINPELKETVRADRFIDLTGKFIAIYTLTESAGTRAKSILESMFPSTKVRVSNNHGGSDKLKVLARDSDYFVVATRSAKHAATDFIKDNRGQERTDLIYPTGKGSSSIVSALLNAVSII